MISSQLAVLDPKDLDERRNSKGEFKTSNVVLVKSRIDLTGVMMASTSTLNRHSTRPS